MHPQPSRTPTGHVSVKDRKGGPMVYVKYRLPDGRQVQKKLGPLWKGPGRPPEGHYTRRLAEEALREILVEAARGTLAGQRRSGATFADAAAEYLRFVEVVRRRDPATVADYRGVVHGAGYLLDTFGPRPLEEIKPRDIEAYKERLIEEGRLSARTITRHLTVLHGIFKRARRVWELRDNPAAADVVERPQQVYTGDFDTYDRDELELLAAAAAQVDRQDAAICKAAAFTGLRQGELLALRWRHVDFVAGLVHVRTNYTGRVEKVPKGKRVRSVPMTGDVVDVLAAHKERTGFDADDDLVFCDAAGSWLCSWALRRRFYEAIARAGLRRIRFHDLRHHFGSVAITVLDAYAVQSYMGHQHYSTTQRYLHHKPRPQDAQRLQDAFSGHAAPRAAADEPVA